MYLVRYGGAGWAAWPAGSARPVESVELPGFEPQILICVTASFQFLAAVFSFQPQYFINISDLNV